ncbi:GNAT family N-acetyltransferase [Legionella israelensis]|uniref:GNAT family N-acetyltransferase n=2 Tax=Legionella israelensis TaxID=454 RepID=A0AAX1ED83_9GAMM|nr:GNAT family N-acetyltransferase [Legionella israelensis]
MGQIMLMLEVVSKQDKNVISNLLQFYMFEFNQISAFKHFRLDDTGKYQQYPYFENYWLEKSRFPYVIKHNESIIGFSLAHDITINKSIDWKLAEFFIMPEFRRQGFGCEAAISTIKSHTGSWEISVLEDNFKAKRFWLDVFHKLSVSYKSYKYQEYEVFELKFNH